jgi:uncharacterized protein (TIGR00297 family)
VAARNTGYDTLCKTMNDANHHDSGHDRGHVPGQDSRHDPRPHQASLRWQSQAVLLAFVPIAAVWVVMEAGQFWYAAPNALLVGAVISVALAALVLIARAATPGAAFTGAVFAAALWLQTPGLHTALWPLLALLLLTFAATRFGRRRKEALGTAEGRRGRTASQVAANLGVAALAGIPLTAAHVFTPVAFGGRAALVAMIAAMAEATADTVSSELGQVLGGTPRLITTWRPVPAGTDGAVSFAGTLAGVVAAAVLAGVAFVALGHAGELAGLGLAGRGPGTGGPGLGGLSSAGLGFSGLDAVLALGAGIAGTLVDSLLGAVPERQGWLNNDAVNALSTLAAALLGAWATGWF